MRLRHLRKKIHRSSGYSSFLKLLIHGIRSRVLLALLGLLNLLSLSHLQIVILRLK